MRRVLIPIIICLLLISILPGNCLAAETNVSATLTVDEAIELAIANSKDLQSASLDLDAAALSRDNAWDDNNAVLLSSYIPGTDLHVSIATGSEANVYSTNYTWLSKLRGYDTALEAVSISVYQKYYDILAAINKLESQRLSAQLDEENLRITELRCQLGLDTQAVLYGAQTKVAASQAALVTAQQDLDQKYITLADYIGLPEGSRPSLDNTVTYVPAKIDDPELAIRSIVDSSPSVWLADENVRLQENTSGLSNDYKMDNINRDKANLVVSMTREKMEQSTRNIYYQLINLQNSYQASLENDRSLQENLRVARLMFDLGMNTKVDVTAAELAASNSRQTLNSLVYQQVILKMTFAKPWASSGLS